MTIHRKNYYEELIDKMMLDGITGLTEDIKAEITKFPTHKKRLTILNLLEENDISHRKLFSSILSIMKENDVTETEHIKQVVTKLREYVEVGAVEKKKYGEVMTPITLVEEMLDTLPNEVWSNPDLKWLDSCCGVGIFPSVIVERLMAGLANIIPDDEARYTHIVENMLHVGELQPKNMFLFLCAFDPEDKYDMNIYTGTYLDEGFDQHMKEVFGVEKFDVITINPPYNSGSENSGSAHTLWDKFITKSLECSLVEGGYLVAVHPDGWRNLGNGFKDVKNLLKSKEMIYLELHNTNDGYKTFGAYTTYDFYCVRNTNNNNFLTKVKFMDGISKMLNVSSMDFIPNGMIKSFEKLIAKEGEERVDLVRSCKYHTQKDFVLAETDETHKHPLVYTTAKDCLLMNI